MQLDIHQVNSNVQKCFYCKRNPPDDKYINLEEVIRYHTELKGAIKIKHKKTTKYIVNRCEQCFKVHQKGRKFIKVIFITSFLCSFVYFLEYWHTSNFGALVLSLMFCVIFILIVNFLTGTYFAKKYDTKPEWGRAGYL